MQIQINKEIRDYTESMFFGLSMRQLIFSVMACGVAIAIYIFTKPLLGMEVSSWLCIISAVPFACMGFVKYNGMSAEKLFTVIIRSTLLMPKHLLFKAENIWCELIHPFENKETESETQG